MSVWNTFDPDMIREMFEKAPQKKGNSIGEKVRIRSIMESRKRRRNVHTQSVGGFETGMLEPISCGESEKPTSPTTKAATKSTWASNKKKKRGKGIKNMKAKQSG